MENVIIREMEEEEIDWCVGVIRRGFGTVAKKFGLTPENCPTNGAFMTAERLYRDRNKGNEMYVLVCNHIIVGFMQLERKDENRIELQKVTVIPEFRHYGYGRMLLEFAARRAKELGAGLMTIGIIEGNTILKEWYLQNGFVHNGTHDFEHLPFRVGFMSMTI